MFTRLCRKPAKQRKTVLAKKNNCTYTDKREFWLLLTVTVFVTVQTGLRIKGMNADVLLLKKDRMRLWDIQESI